MTVQVKDRALKSGRANKGKMEERRDKIVVTTDKIVVTTLSKVGQRGPFLD